MVTCYNSNRKLIQGWGTKKEQDGTQYREMDGKHILELGLRKGQE